MNALRQRWPEYQKAATQVQLAERITLERIIQVCDVEPELRAFLTAVGIIQ